MFFFEKKNQKTFATFGRSLTQALETDSDRTGKKFFGSFFQKRTTSFLPLLILRLAKFPRLHSPHPRMQPRRQHIDVQRHHH